MLVFFIMVLPFIKILVSNWCQNTISDYLHFHKS